MPRVGDYRGHLLSTAMLVPAILVVSSIFFTTVEIDYSLAELLAIGGVWVALTVGFEFLVGYVEGTPVAVTLGQCDILAGQVWIFVPLALLLSPLAFGWYLAG